MPVTIKPAPHNANIAKIDNRQIATDAKALLAGSCRNEINNMTSTTFLQTSFEQLDVLHNVVPVSHGFLHGAIRAYNEHHHLVLRPEDVWFAILSQLSVYVCGNAEKLRDLFVAHEGKMELVVEKEPGFEGPGEYGVDWSKFVEKFTGLIDEKVKVADLKDWIIPTFTTTTETDKTVASILFMATMQNYFSYTISLACGLPSVTLLGEKSDWKQLALKAERLSIFGEEPAQWLKLLKPILSRFISSFEKPDEPEIKDFWQNIAHYCGGGSGPTYLSGWMTAFCFWNSQGICLFKPNIQAPWNCKGEKPLILDEAHYHFVKTTEIPPGWASVPVKVVKRNGQEISCVAVAGSVGMRFSTSSGKGLDTVAVESGWWMYEKKSEEVMKAER